MDATSFSPTGSVLPRSYVSSSSVFITAVLRSRINELWVLQTISELSYGSLRSWASTVFPRHLIREVLWLPPPPANRSPAVEEVMWPQGSSYFSLKDQRQNRFTIVLVVFKKKKIFTATLLLKTTGNKYPILKSLKKMPRSGEPTWSPESNKGLKYAVWMQGT